MLLSRVLPVMAMAFSAVAADLPVLHETFETFVSKHGVVMLRLRAVSK